MAALGIYLMASALLVAAGVLKAVRPGEVARAVAAVLPGPSPRIWGPVVRVLAAAEAGLGAAAIAHPAPPVALAVAASYLGFAGWVLWARARGGSLSSCGCFATPDVPPTVAHAALNLLAAGGALGLAVSAPPASMVAILSAQYLHGLPLVGASALAAWLAYVVMAPLARLSAARRVPVTTGSGPVVAPAGSAR